MMKALYFDLDGTLCDFYGVENWLGYLMEENTYPYEVAKPMLNFSLLARYLNILRAFGWKIGVISWTSKSGSESYNLTVETVKRMWLARHLPSVEWDEIKIVRYGTNKYKTCGGGILFDDEEGNRNTWEDEAYEPYQILEILHKLIKEG